MLKSIIALFILGSTTAYSATMTTLDCLADVHGIHKIQLAVDPHTKTQQVILTLSTGVQATRTLATNEADSILDEGLFLMTKGELTLTLTKQHVDQYIFDYFINRKGNGFFDSTPIDCN